MDINTPQGDALPESDIVLSEQSQDFSAAEISMVPVAMAEAGAAGAPATSNETGAFAPAAAEDRDEEEEFHFPSPFATNNAVQEKDVYAPLDRPITVNDIVLPLPPDTHARTANYLELQPNINIDATEEGELWQQTLREGLTQGSFHDGALPAAQRKEAEYRQRIKHGDRYLEAARPKLGDDGPLLKGERGVLRVNALLGRGSIVQIPLWHSGFWITFKCPKESRLLDMYQRQAEEKINFGRITHGLAFANYTVFTVDALVALAMESVYETSVKDLASATELRSMISSLDLNTIAWGMACAIWPRGFHYTRSLLDEKGQKTNTIQGKLNVGNLMWVDDKSVNDWQRGHMASRQTSSMTKESIKLYNTHFTRGQAKTFALNDVVSMTVRVPNLEQYLNAGQAWVNETVAAVNAAFTEETSSDRRNKLIFDRGRATSLRQYSHWIEAFEFPTIGKKMTDAATIAENCSSLSGDDAIREKYYQVMREYINDSTIAIIATPLANEEEKNQTSERFPWLLPLDPVSTFFTLLSQKVAQIQARL